MPKFGNRAYPANMSRWYKRKLGEWLCATGYHAWQDHYHESTHRLRRQCHRCPARQYIDKKTNPLRYRDPAVVNPQGFWAWLARRFQ